MSRRTCGAAGNAASGTSVPLFEARRTAPASPWPTRRPITLLDDAIAALPEPARVAVVLHYLEGWSRERTAAALGISEEALKKRLQRAIAALRDRLGASAVTPAALSALAAPAVSSHPLAQALAAYRAGAPIPGHVAHAFTQGLSTMHLLFIKSAIASLVLLLAVAGAALGAASQDGAPPAPSAAPAAGAGMVQGYGLPVGTGLSWSSELLWRFTPDPSVTTDPGQFYVPALLRSLVLWHGEALAPQAPGELRLRSVPRWLWSSSSMQPGANQKAGAQGLQVSADTGAGELTLPELVFTLDDQQLRMRTTGLNILACDYSPILTYFGIPDLFMPVPGTLQPGMKAALHDGPSM